MGIEKTAILVVFTCLVCSGSVARGDEVRQAPLSLFEEGDSHILAGRFSQACEVFAGLLSAGPVWATAGVYRLESVKDYCGGQAALPMLKQVLESRDVSPATRWRAADLGHYLAGKFRLSDKAGWAPIVVQARAVRHSAPAASRYVALTATPLEVESPESAPDVPKTSSGMPLTMGNGVQVSVHPFSLPKAGRVDGRISFAGPGVAWLGSQPLLSVGPDLVAGRKGKWTFSVDADAGCHRMVVVQAVAGAADPLEVELTPGSGAVPGDCQGDAPAWSPLSTALSCGVEGGLVCAWAARAEGLPGVESVEEALDRALESGNRLLLALDLLASRFFPTDRAEDAALKLLGTYVVDSPDCYAALELARRHLVLADDRPARQVLDSLAPECSTTAAGMLLLAELAQLSQWQPLERKQIQDAYRRYPAVCGVVSIWYSQQLSEGNIVPEHSLAVDCEEVHAAWRRFLASAGKLKPDRALSPADFAGLPRCARADYLARQIDRGLKPGAEVWQLLSSNPQVAWTLADLLWARGEKGAALSLGALARSHRGTYGPLRAHAGRMHFWQKAISRMSTPEDVIEDYLAHTWAEEMPQVTVLDEAVILAGTNGWSTVLYTTILHVRSPDAAEAIGEVGAAGDEEIVELAVRKHDGTWIGPRESLEGEVKDTLSLPGLSPGDFVVKTSVREVPTGAGFQECYALPSFYFGGHDQPVFKARLVIIPEGQPPPELEIMVDGEVETSEQEGGIRVFEKNRVDPVPEEPSCPDPAAGIAAVHAATTCLTWGHVRDRFADTLLRLCNAPLPESLTDGGVTPQKVYRFVLDSVTQDGSALRAAPLDAILAAGRGNVQLALYCALGQAGFQAELVAVNTVASLPLDLRRPSPAFFDASLVRVSHNGEVAWLDPYEQSAQFGYVRPGLRERTGMVLSPLFPRLLVKVPGGDPDEGWDIRLTGKVNEDGNLGGRLTVRAAGRAIAELGQVFRQGTEKAQARAVQMLLGQMLPRSVAVKHEYKMKDGRAHLSVDYKLQLDMAHRKGSVVLFLAPSPRADWSRLATRTSPLFFPGYLPTGIRVELVGGKRFDFGMPEVRTAVSTPHGDAALRTVTDDGDVTISKSVQARPRVVAAEEYAGFLQFMATLRDTNGVRVEVRRVVDD